jgi:hypothetical protein
VPQASVHCRLTQSHFTGVNQDSHDPADRVQHDYRQYRVSGWHSSFALDRQLKTNVASILPFKDNQEILVHCFIPDETVTDSQLIDWIMILASTVKLVEIITLHRLGSQVLWWSSALGWILCFTAAVILQCCNAARDNPKNIRSTADFLIGKLPSYNRTGGSSKRIILGQPISIRGNPLWRLTWIVGALSNLVGISVTFYALTKEMEASTKVMYAWVSFQAGWLVLRSIAYHIIPDASGAYNENMAPQSWKKASSFSRTRTLRLLLATSIHQIHEHVHRGFFAYQEDMLSLTSPQQLALVLQQTSWQTTDILPIDIFLGLGKTKIDAIIGDSWLRTLVWITGAKVDNAEMYDTVVVLVQAPSGTKYLIPGVRVMAMIRSSDAGDLKRKTPSFDPRGRANTGSRGQWIYWIPIATEAEPGKYGWLEIKCDPFSVLGPLRNYRVLSGMELDKHLGAGVLNISLQGTVDMEKVLEASRLSAGLTLQMVSQADMLQ